MQRKHGERVLIGEAISGVDVPVPATHDASAAPLHRCRSGESACLGQRSGPANVWRERILP